MTTITPATKIAELLERWPELEAVLIAQAPAFQKLRNPVLRRTIARVATLEQAAGIAGLSPRDLVITLRRAAGQAVGEDPLPAERPVAAVPPCRAATATGAGATGAAPIERQGPVIDVDAMLDAGEVPLKPVFDAMASLEPGRTLRIVASFRPTPLIDKLEERGHRCRVESSTDGRIQVVATRGG